MFKRPRKVVPGKPIRTRSINDLVDGATALNDFGVTTPLTLTDGPDGPQIAYGDPEGFWARITGGSNPYSYQEVMWYGGAQHDVTGGRTGTTSVRPAYDANGITTLPVGWVDFLRPAFPGEYVFQSVRYGTASCTGTLTVNVKCGGVTNLSGATVSVTLGATTVSGTTNASGNVVLTLNAAGTWAGTVTLAGYATINFTQVFACSNVTKNISTWLSPITIAGKVRGCGSLPLPGASVTLTQSASTIGTGTTDGSGNFSISVNSDGSNITITVSKSRFNSSITTISGVYCSPPSSTIGNVTLTPVGTGYDCDCCGPVPVPTTLYLTTMFGSVVTLTSTGLGAWTGTDTVNLLAKTDCSGSTNTVAVTFNYVFCTGASISGSFCTLGAGVHCCPSGPICSSNGVIADTILGYNPNGYGYGVSSYTNVPFNASGTMSYYDGTDTQFFGSFTITE